MYFSDNDDIALPEDAEDFDAEEIFPEDDGDNMSDVEADADTLRNVGWGTDEDYGYYGEDSFSDW